jgi:hypothetical protein
MEDAAAIQARALAEQQARDEVIAELLNDFTKQDVIAAMNGEDEGLSEMLDYLTRRNLANAKTALAAAAE